MLKRVVCTLGETMDTLPPTSRLMSVDLPALGSPMMATMPQDWLAVMRDRFQPEAGRCLLGGATGISLRLRGRVSLHAGFDGEQWRMRWPCGFEYLVRRDGKPPRLRPFLQSGFGILGRRCNTLCQFAPARLD